MTRNLRWYLLLCFAELTILPGCQHLPYFSGSTETAYEVHSCLVDALETGTGKAARSQYGLKKIPAVAGKTGTAYDFTDALFAGYDNNFTCAVWAGFDKPQKIYRGAFGHELAMPVWVDIMNAAAEHYPPGEIKQPPGLKQVEICSHSGLLATDKCYDTVKSTTGDSVQKRTTYMEIATAAQMPAEPCNVHGEPRTRLVRDVPATAFPRAELAVDLNELKPVIVKSPTLLADKDPYNSAKSIAKADAAEEKQTAQKETPAKIDNGAGGSRATKTGRPERVDELGSESINEKSEDGKPILKAIPVEPTKEKSEQPVEIRRAIPVGPLDEMDDNALLKSATPPPSDPDQ